MTPQILEVTVILIAALALLISERLRADLVALLVLLALALTGLVEPLQVVSGFSSPAVLVVCAVLVLSAGLQRVGLATWLGHGMGWLGGRHEVRLVVVIMATAAVLSFFMNTLAIVAVLLPAVMDLARRRGLAPSRLLMPLTFGALLGGLTTMFATLPNLLVSTVLGERGFEPFGLFDFLPVGLAAAVAGILFVALVGRRLLPTRDLQKESAAVREGALSRHYELHERMFVLRLPMTSALRGKTLEESRLGSALGLHVVAVLRAGQTHLAPERATRLHARDRLLVQGTPDQLDDLERWRSLAITDQEPDLAQWLPTDVDFAEVQLAAGTRFAGQTLAELDLRRVWGVNVLAVKRGAAVRRSRLQEWQLETGDQLLVQGLRPQVAALAQTAGLEQFRTLPSETVSGLYAMEERFFTVQVPGASPLDGRSLQATGLGEALGVTVLAIRREGQTILMPAPTETLRGGDLLLLAGRTDDLLLLQGLNNLELEREMAPELGEFESERFGLLEAVLSPRTQLSGKNLAQLRFRDRYGLTVLGLWRAGQAVTTNLRSLPLAFGDALLLYGPREKLTLLARDHNFLLLTQAAQKPPRTEKAPAAMVAMLAFLLPALFGWLPIHLAALLGAALMVLFGCVRLEAAYAAIELRAVVLIAGMLPLSTALEDTGAAALAADTLLRWVGGGGPLAILSALFALTSLGTCVIPGVALVVLLAPLALQMATESGMSPHAVLMAIALAASGGFLSPVAHPSNILIMGPGGYRFADFLKLGVPLTLVVFIVVLIVLPVFWPLRVLP